MKPTVWTIAIAALTVATAAWAQAPSDAQIVAIVLAANQVDIEAGTLAASKASNPQVKDFAQTMVSQHSDVDTTTTKLATKLGLTPQSNPTVQSIKAGGTANVSHLKQLDGAAFDTAYINHEVAYHQQLVYLVTKTLTPSAQNPVVKMFLAQTGTTYGGHLFRANQIHASLEK